MHWVPPLLIINWSVYHWFITWLVVFQPPGYTFVAVKTVRTAKSVNSPITSPSLFRSFSPIASSNRTLLHPPRLFSVWSFDSILTLESTQTYLLGRRVSGKLGFLSSDLAVLNKVTYSNQEDIFFQRRLLQTISSAVSFEKLTQLPRKKHSCTYSNCDEADDESQTIAVNPNLAAVKPK